MNESAAVKELLMRIDDLACACGRARGVKECFALLRECHLALDECVRVGRRGVADVAVQEKVSAARCRLIKLGNDIALKLNGRFF